MIPNPFTRPNAASQSFTLSDNDLRLLLDQVKEPCLLIHLGKKRIVAANLQFTEFTGFGTTEMIKAEIEEIIINCDYELIADGAVNQWTISRKNQNPAKVTGLSRYISHKEKLALLMFQTESTITPGLQESSVNILDELSKLLKEITEIDFKDLINGLIDISTNGFFAKHAVFYMQPKKNELVKKINSSGEKLFPESIPAIEIKRIKQIDFWEPGKRVLSEIQRVGRLNNLSVIVTIPVFISEESNGLLILVFNDKNIREKHEALIRVFAEWINVVVKLHGNLEFYAEKRSKVSAEIDQYSQFYENASDCAVVLNKDNVILDFNNNTPQFLKYSPIELLNQKAQVIFENSEIHDTLSDTEGNSFISVQDPVYIYDREGNKIPVLYKILPVSAIGVERKLLILQDATRQVDAERKIKQYESKAAMGEVVAKFAHEVRNPIHSLDSGLQLLMKKIDEDDPNRNTIDHMHEDCIRMNALMESVLSYSRQKAENFKDVNIAYLLNRIVNRSKAKYKASGVDVIIKSGMGQAVVFGDQRSLEQAFINLITNAFDAVKQNNGGIISIQIEKSKQEDETLEIFISDTGSGIPPEILEKLFEPFVSDKAKGTGLGLAITQQLIEAHQGRIGVETYPGGTIFKVTLPFREIQGEQA